MIARLMLAALVTPLLAGCGGSYLASLPDVVAAEGGTARVAAQFRRQEVWRFAPPVEDAAVTVRVAGGPRRAAFTDADGCAAVDLTAPDEAGRYTLTLRHQDPRGVEFTATGHLYVLDPQRLAVAVDWRCVTDAAAGPLRALGKAGVQLVYIVKGGADSDRIGRTLEARGLPDGPVISWDADRSEITGALPVARKSLPSLVILATDRADLAAWAAPLQMAVAAPSPDWIALAARVSRAAAAMGTADFDALSLRDIEAALAQP